MGNAASPFLHGSHGLLLPSDQLLGFAVPKESG
jgi:hypothetical protein